MPPPQALASTLQMRPSFSLFEKKKQKKILRGIVVVRGRRKGTLGTEGVAPFFGGEAHTYTHTNTDSENDKESVSLGYSPTKGPCQGPLVASIPLRNSQPTAHP
eukprot:TRINITY_DN3286_c0_g4_i1.p3 TRINITY_DN3286_c0_g4~~TRINITY_DN3286_c0_g4_i1.p3  ORF type:complete len:104 (-),score=4.72 TRINITY_DN3286_c0_g4_i1:616-927(-)